MFDTPSPILFQPLLKPRVWGGRTLEGLGKTLPPGEAIGESWELADLPDSIPGGRSVIAAPSQLGGRTLRDALLDSTTRRMIMGDAALTGEGGFPLLIKYLDARQNLSVQVHPSFEYARRHPGAHIKSEAWVVIHADPGAVIYKGIKPGVTQEAFARHVASGEVVNDLVTISARPGDCHYLPTGECHALGAGIVVAEVQTPSDTTFRVYDWGRPASAGRELHLAQALECIDFDGKGPTHRLPAPPRPQESNQVDGITTTPLTQTEFFEIERVDAQRGAEFEVVTSGSPQVWMMIAGKGVLSGSFGSAVDLRPGMTILVPAAARAWRARFDAPAWMLCVRLPSVLRNTLA